MLEDNKAVVIAFFDKIDNGDIDGAFAMMTEDATWWIPSDAPGGITLTKAQMYDAIQVFGKAFKTPPKIDRGRMTAEGARVCLEQVSRGGETNGGATYANDYHLLITLRSGKVCEIREYMNPMLGVALMAEMQAGA